MTVNFKLSEEMKNDVINSHVTGTRQGKNLSPRQGLNLPSVMGSKGHRYGSCLGLSVDFFFVPCS